MPRWIGRAPGGPNQGGSNLGVVLVAVEAAVGVDGPLDVLGELVGGVRVRAAGRVGAVDYVAAG